MIDDSVVTFFAHREMWQNVARSSNKLTAKRVLFRIGRSTKPYLQLLTYV